MVKQDKTVCFEFFQESATINLRKENEKI